MGLAKKLRKILTPQLVISDRAITGRNLITTYGLQRSGQHLIINWICRGLSRSTVHFNYCKFVSSGLFYKLTPNEGRRVIYDGDDIDDSGAQDTNRLLSSLPDTLPHNLLFSMEDIDITKRSYRKLSRKYNAYRIVILRDPANWLASSLRHNVHSEKTLRYHVLTLKKHLQLAVSGADRKDERLLFINYNQFCSDPDYRATIAEKLKTLDEFEIQKADKALSIIPNFGGGSSFGETTGQSERWRHYESDRAFRSLICDDALYQLAKEFFGDIDAISGMKKILDEERCKPKLFYIGLPRSGTTTMHNILTQLGLRSCHFSDDLLSDPPDWSAVLRYDALGDSPIPALYKELDQRHPNSKFILTKRDKESWLESMKWLYKHGKVIWKWPYHKAEKFDGKALSQQWDDYHDDVRQHFSDRPDDLMVIELKDGFDSDEICDFLGIERKAIQIEKSNARRHASLAKRFKYEARLMFYKLKSIPKR